jgi:hypothetical protein
MSIADQREPKRPPWNERAVRCVVNHLIPTMKPYAGHGTDKLVLIFVARHAHPAGCGITVSRETLARDWLGCSGRTVSVALARLRRNGYLAIDGREAHGGYRHRIMLCQRCRLNTAAAPCQRCPAPTAAATPSRPPAVSSGHPNREVQGEPAATTAIPGSRQAGRSPDGDGSRGPRAGPRTPGARRQAAEAVPQHPQDRLERSTVGTLLLFPARSADAGAHGGAARTGESVPTGRSHRRSGTSPWPAVRVRAGPDPRALEVAAAMSPIAARPPLPGVAAHRPIRPSPGRHRRRPGAGRSSQGMPAPPAPAGRAVRRPGQARRVASSSVVCSRAERRIQAAPADRSAAAAIVTGPGGRQS